MNKKIKDITIQVIPLSINDYFLRFQFAEIMLKAMTPMIINPSLIHIAIQINLENSKDILIIEYGKYLTIDSNFTNSGIGSINSSKEPRENENDNIYYYINKDGARITLFKYEYLKSYEKNMSYFLIDKNNISGLISHLISIQYYNITLENYLNKVAFDTAKFFHRVECDIKNKIKIKE